MILNSVQSYFNRSAWTGLLLFYRRTARKRLHRFSAMYGSICWYNLSNSPSCHNTSGASLKKGKAEQAFTVVWLNKRGMDQPQDLDQTSNLSQALWYERKATAHFCISRRPQSIQLTTSLVSAQIATEDFRRWKRGFNLSWWSDERKRTAY